MRSVLFLEQPGRWRTASVAALLLLGALPVFPLLSRALRPDAPALGDAFCSSLRLSAVVAGGASLLGGVVGLPLGILAALYDFPGRRALLVITTLPLVVPPFLWAIGWSALAIRLPPSLGCVVVFAAATTPLVLLATYAATRELSRSQVEAARLAGGEARVLCRAAQHTRLPALLAAALGGVLTLADPGTGQILGAHSAAAEVLTSFAARYDVTLAARQGLALAALVLALSVPLAALAGPQLAHAVLGRQTTHGVTRHRGGATAATIGFVIVTAVNVGLPLGGLLLPLVSGPDQHNHFGLVLFAALATAARTATNTLLYSGGAALVATTLGFAVALAVGRSGRLRSVALAVALALFAWPPAASALGVVATAAASPPWLDPLLRSRLTVCVVLGLRLFPISTVLALRAWGAMSPSWVHAAALHGVSPWTYLRRVAWPALRPSAAGSLALVSLLASADVGTVLMLHPPGQDSLPLAIFTVMANAPESTVSGLCLVYLLAAFTMLSTAFRFAPEEP